MDSKLNWSKQMLLVTKICFQACGKKNAERGFVERDRRCIENCAKSFRMSSFIVSNEVKQAFSGKYSDF